MASLAPRIAPSADGFAARDEAPRCPKCGLRQCVCEMDVKNKSPAAGLAPHWLPVQFSKIRRGGNGGPIVPEAVEAKERRSARPARVVDATATVARRRYGAIAGPVVISPSVLAGDRLVLGALCNAGTNGRGLSFARLAQTAERLACTREVTRSTRVVGSPCSTGVRATSAARLYDVHRSGKTAARARGLRESTGLGIAGAGPARRCRELFAHAGSAGPLLTATPLVEPSGPAISPEKR
jgi:hypothetical protein